MYPKLFPPSADDPEFVAFGSPPMDRCALFFCDASVIEGAVKIAADELHTTTPSYIVKPPNHKGSGAFFYQSSQMYCLVASD